MQKPDLAALLNSYSLAQYAGQLEPMLELDHVTEEQVTKV